MPRPTKVERLEPDIRDMIGRLQERGRTLDEIMDALRPLDVDVSRSGLHRYLASQAKLGERLRRSKAVAEVLVRQLGDGAETRLSTMNSALIQDLMFQWFERAAELGEDGEPQAGDGEEVTISADPQTLAYAAKAIKDLAQARRHDVEYIKEVEKRAAEKARAAAASDAATAAKEKGLSADVVAAIRARILGVQA